MEDRRVIKVKVPGNGRFTLGGGARGVSELRVYANKSDKDYVLALRDGVASCRRADIEIEHEPLPGTMPKPKSGKWYMPSTAPTVTGLTSDDLDDLAERIVSGADLTRPT